MPKNDSGNDDRLARADDGHEEPPKAEEQSDPQDDRVAELEQQLLRVKADFENHKRRTDEERFKIAGVAQAEVVLKLLPVIDSFERAFATVPSEVEKTDWYKGVTAIHQQFEKMLEDLGISRIKSVGEPFDPAVHEAVANESSDKFDKETVSEEFEAGYRYGDEVIRHSKVKVSSGKE